jgi:transglutaminase/protease-like cytokinesis protein 3
MIRKFTLIKWFYFFMFVSIFANRALSQSKKEIIFNQKQKIDSLNEALEIEKNNFIKAEKKFNKNNEQIKIINENILNWHDQYVNSFHEIDFHIIKCPNSIKKNADELIEYFNEIAKTDLEKTRAIYVWITNNIRYDDNAYNTDNYNDGSAEVVLNTKKAVCAGYAELFTFFCKKMNLEAKTISGYVKGYSYNIGDSFEGKESNHAWNMVKIDGEWRMFDATWGEGYGITNSNGKLVSVTRFTDNWFNVSPYEIIFSHYPENNFDLFIGPKFTLKDFESIPNIDISAFRTGLLDAKETLNLILSDKKYTSPVVYSLNTFIKVVQAPKNGILSKNTRYNFELYVPRAKSIMLIDEAGNTVHFKKSDNEPIYTLNYSQKSSGVFSIVIDFYNEKNPLTFIEYTIK